MAHRGRSTGREYRTPVNAFKRSGGGFAIALTYGVSQWTRNVLAQGGCDLEVQGRRLAMTSTWSTTRRAGWSPPVRPILRLIGVEDFLQLDPGPRAEGR